jgi:hypothetical protein
MLGQKPRLHFVGAQYVADQHVTQHHGVGENLIEEFEPSSSSSTPGVAAMLFLSPKTVDTYRSRMMQKLGIGDLPGLVKFAIQHGVTQLD